MVAVARKNDLELSLVEMDHGHQNMNTLDQLLKVAKASYSCRHVPQSAMKTLIVEGVRPQSGDVVLAEIDNIRQHKRIEDTCGRRAHLHKGDTVILCYGNRYAPDQFEAYIPDDLGPCHMVAAGGIAAFTSSRHSGIKAATQIKPIGLIGDANGRPLNIIDWAMPEKMLPSRSLPMITAVVGTSMNAGKTTTAAHLIKGLSRSGMSVGAAKLTGTGAGLDVWLMQDSGAHKVLDFTDVGYASTFLLSIEELESIFIKLLSILCAEKVDAIVFEVADGLLQRETSALLTSPLFKKYVDQVIFAASDALGAYAGVNWLKQEGLPVKAVSGALTASPLAIRETEDVVDLPVLDPERLTAVDLDLL